MGGQYEEVVIPFLGFPFKNPISFHCENKKDPFLILERGGRVTVVKYAQSLLDKNDLNFKRGLNRDRERERKTVKN